MLMETSPFSLEIADSLFADVVSFETVVLTWWRLVWKYRRDLIKRIMDEFVVQLGDFR